MKKEEALKIQKELVMEIMAYVYDKNTSKHERIIFMKDTAHCQYFEFQVVTSVDSYSREYGKVQIDYLVEGEQKYNFKDTNYEVSIKLMKGKFEELKTIYNESLLGRFYPVENVCVNLIGERVFQDKEKEVEVVSIPSKTTLIVKDEDEIPYEILIERIFIKE